MHCRLKHNRSNRGRQTRAWLVPGRTANIWIAPVVSRVPPWLAWRAWSRHGAGARVSARLSSPTLQRALGVIMLDLAVSVSVKYTSPSPPPITHALLEKVKVLAKELEDKDLEMELANTEKELAEKEKEIAVLVKELDAMPMPCTKETYGKLVKDLQGEIAAVISSNSKINSLEKELDTVKAERKQGCIYEEEKCRYDYREARRYSNRVCLKVGAVASSFERFSNKPQR